MIPRSSRGSASPSAAALLPWTAGFALVAFLLGAHVGRPIVLAAAGGTSASADADNDALSDSLEEVLGLDPDGADTDRDGWSDTEELARGSDPKNKSEVPSASEIDVGVQAYSEHGIFHVVLTVFTKGGLMTGWASTRSSGGLAGTDLSNPARVGVHARAPLPRGE